MGPARAHGAEVADLCLQRRDHGGDVELVVVGEDAHRIAWAERPTDPLEQAVRPVHDDLVGEREPGLGREHLPGVADGDPVAEQLGQAHEGGGEVDGAEDEHLRRRGEALDEHRQLVLASLAARPVVAHPRRACGQLRLRVTADDAIEVGVAERTAPVDTGLDEQRTTDPWPGHDRGECDRPSCPQRGGEVVEEGAGAAHRSRRSTNRCMVPPHVRPTAKASSSL